MGSFSEFVLSISIYKPIPSLFLSFIELYIYYFSDLFKLQLFVLV